MFLRNACVYVSVHMALQPEKIIIDIFTVVVTSLSHKSKDWFTGIPQSTLIGRRLGMTSGGKVCNTPTRGRGVLWQKHIAQDDLERKGAIIFYSLRPVGRTWDTCQGFPIHWVTRDLWIKKDYEQQNALR